MDITTKARLNNGVEMPMLGLGTWVLTGEDAENAVLYALEAGYRHIDTASAYQNEREVGRAIRKSTIPREKIFVTTKLWNTDHNDPIKACDESLKRLELDYVDLYLIHWPVEIVRDRTWKVMEQLYEEGKCRAIGVSNYTIRHLNELLKDAKVIPAVNQVEFTPYLYQKELLEFCKAKGIQLEAYSPLTRGKRLNDPKLKAIVARYSKTSAQILIRWSLQHDLVVIPKSKSRERIIENANVFDFVISSEDMKLLNSFDDNYHLCWDPTDEP